MAIAVMKVPLIIVGSLLLCVPSFYIFTALAGVDYIFTHLHDIGTWEPATTKVSR